MLPLIVHLPANFLSGVVGIYNSYAVLLDLFEFTTTIFQLTLDMFTSHLVTKHSISMLSIEKIKQTWLAGFGNVYEYNRLIRQAEKVKNGTIFSI